MKTVEGDEVSATFIIVTKQNTKTGHLEFCQRKGFFLTPMEPGVGAGGAFA